MSQTRNSQAGLISVFNNGKQRSAKIADFAVNYQHSAPELEVQCIKYTLSCRQISCTHIRAAEFVPTDPVQSTIFCLVCFYWVLWFTQCWEEEVQLPVMLFSALLTARHFLPCFKFCQHVATLLLWVSGAQAVP